MKKPSYKEKKLLLAFVFRTGMYIPKVDFNNMMSFIMGIEMIKYAESQDLHFLNIEEFLERKYQIPFPATGTTGQIKVLAKAKKLSLVEAFKKVLFEMITENMDEKTLQILEELNYKNVIFNTINRNENVRFLFPEEPQAWLNKIFTQDEIDFIQNKLKQ